MFGFDVQKVCENLNYRHRMAQYAGRASVALHTQVLSCDALVCDIQCSLKVCTIDRGSRGLVNPHLFQRALRTVVPPLFCCA